MGPTLHGLLLQAQELNISPDPINLKIMPVYTLRVDQVELVEKARLALSAVDYRSRALRSPLQYLIRGTPFAQGLLVRETIPKDLFGSTGPAPACRLPSAGHRLYR